jgi:hypothetical protein
MKYRLRTDTIGAHISKNRSYQFHEPFLVEIRELGGGEGIVGSRERVVIAALTRLERFLIGSGV